MTPQHSTLTVRDDDGLVDRAVQLELGRVELGIIVSALRRAIDILGDAERDTLHARRGDGLVTLDQWWSISSTLGSPSRDAGLVELVRAAVEERVRQGETGQVRTTVEAMADDLCDDIRRTSQALREAVGPGAAPWATIADELEQVASASDAADQCQRLRQLAMSVPSSP